MPSLPQKYSRSVAGRDRRLRPRRRAESLIYADFGNDNGGIVLNIGEGGLAYQSVEPVDLDHIFYVKFKLPETDAVIDARAKVAWVSSTGKGGGLAFTSLSSEDLRQLRAWLRPEFCTAEAEPEVVEAVVEGSAKASRGPGAVTPARAVASSAADIAEVPARAAAVAHVAPHAEESRAPQFVSKFMVEVETPPAPAKSARPPAPPAETKHGRPFAPVEAHAHATPSPLAQTLSLAGKPAKTLDTDRENPAPPEVAAASEVDQRREALLKIAVGALLGSSIVLAAMAAIPALQSGINARNTALQASQSVTGPFQVEVVDLNTHRWTLTSDRPPEESSTSAPAPRRSQPTAPVHTAPTAQESAPAPVQQTAATRTALQKELELQKPRQAESNSAPSDVRVPSIFDGITPPVGAIGPAVNAMPAAPLGPTQPAPPVAAVQPAAPVSAAPVQPAPVAAQPASVPTHRITNLQAPVLTQRVPPTYPPLARSLRVQGNVRVSATIAKDGVPRNLKILSGDPRLIDAALVAIRQWRYSPATLDGEPVESQTEITVSFALN